MVLVEDVWVCIVKGVKRYKKDCQAIWALPFLPNIAMLEGNIWKWHKAGTWRHDQWEWQGLVRYDTAWPMSLGTPAVFLHTITALPHISHLLHHKPLPLSPGKPSLIHCWPLANIYSRRDVLCILFIWGWLVTCVISTSVSNIHLGRGWLICHRAGHRDGECRQIQVNLIDIPSVSVKLTLPFQHLWLASSHAICALISQLPR